jgi:hypothetical protein
MKPLRETRFGRAFAELFWGTRLWSVLRKTDQALRAGAHRIDPKFREHDQRQSDIVLRFDAETQARLDRNKEEQRG